MRTVLGYVVLAAASLAGCGPGPGADSDAVAVPAASGRDDEPQLVADGDEGPFAARATVLESPEHGPQLCLGGVAESYPPQCGGLDIVGWRWDRLDPDGYESASGTTWGDFVVVGTLSGRTFTITDEPLPPSAAAELLPPQPEAPRLDTPCPEPPGGWRPTDPERATEAAMNAALAAAQRTSGYAGAWLDQRLPDSELSELSGANANDPTRLVLNVATAGDAAALERDVQRIWGGALCVSAAPRSEAALLAIQERLRAVPDLLGSAPDPRAGRVDLMVPVARRSLQDELDEAYGEGVVRLRGALRPVPDRG